MHPYRFDFKVFSLLLIGFLLGSCDSDTNPTTEAPNFEVLEDYSYVATHTENTLEQLYNLTLGTVSSTLDWEHIELYKITYQTQTFAGEAVIASGLLLLPDEFNEAHPLISLQHGTQLSDSQAPSTANLFNSETAIGALLAGQGFAVVMPDYLGYQSSNQLPHPYEEQSTLGQTTYDMLRAGRELIAHLSHTLDNRLYLVGYSEGGYATMALHRKIESENTYSVTHSFPAAGAYNKTAFSQAVLQRDENLPFMATYLWVLSTYNNLYPQLNRPWNTIVQDPYVRLMETFNPLGPQASDLIQIPQNPQQLFRPEFIQGVVQGTDTAFMEVLAANDNFDWAPQAPITLYHGTEDTFVWPLNSQTAFDAMQQRGATVNYVELEGGDHGSSVGPYIQAVFSQLLGELD